MIHANQWPSFEHEWSYNAPTANEVSAIVIGSDDDYIQRKDIILRRPVVLNAIGNETLARISVSHRKYDALCYPPFIP